MKLKASWDGRCGWRHGVKVNEAVGVLMCDVDSVTDYRRSLQLTRAPLSKSCPGWQDNNSSNLRTLHVLHLCTVPSFVVVRHATGRIFRQRAISVHCDLRFFHRRRAVNFQKWKCVRLPSPPFPYRTLLSPTLPSILSSPLPFSPLDVGPLPSIPFPVLPFP